MTIRQGLAQAKARGRSAIAVEASPFWLFGDLTLLGLLGILGGVGRLAAAVGIDMKDAFSLFEHFNPGVGLKSRST